ncbi:hypothetical protein BJV74DRAFT_886055 [Russula compacta]|nr:hypothetical protein BJV74DRAFT_886055 [Russula compacta]
MSATVMQPSHDEIQREVENLRDIKRRSTLQGGPGVLILDPDLPTPGAQAAAAQATTYWGPSDDSSSSDSHSHEDASGSDSASDDPSHLFWVPANMHPEIDPGQFRAFLKEHARTPADGTLGRSESFGSASLGRKKSMLSRQYRPSENDGVEDEHIVPLRRNRSTLYANSGPQLTIKDLEKLDELVEEASQSRDPSKLRSVLRRSLSINMSPSVIDDLGHAMPDSGDDADSPIIVPRPGQILRRTARTKIRKSGQTGEGAHRFNATRRGAGAKPVTPPPAPDPRSSSDLSTSDHSDAEVPRRQRVLSNESLDGAPRLVRPESYSVESFIFDAYARDDVNEDEPKAISPPPTQSPLRRSLSPPPPPALREPEPIPPIQVVPPAQPTPALPPLQHPLPQRASSLVTPVSVDTPSRSPSPVTAFHSDPLYHTRPESRPVQSPSTLPGPQGFDPKREKEKEKDKKGLFKWGGGEKKGKKDQRDKEKDAGFFGSLFGSKKKTEESPPIGLAHGQSGREAAVALLGASKSSRGYVPPASPQPQGVNNYSRYPIHVERAIYRLSHIKLANPRRALYEQVLISNLMFWYLGVINKTQQPQSQQQAQQRQGSAEQAQAVTGGSGLASQKEREEKERTEVEEAEHERGEAKLALQAQGRRGSLTKAPPSNAGSRRAEQPVRGPQYDMQHRAMEQEYGVAFSGAGARPMTAPPGAGYVGTAPGGPAQMQLSMSTSGSISPGAVPQRHARSPPPPTTATGSPVRYVPPPPLPPPPPPLPSAALSSPPTSVTGQVLSSTPLLNSNNSNNNNNNNSNNQQPLKPVQVQQAAAAFTEGGRLPTRSTSANAVPPVNVRAPGRKVLSAHAVLPPGARRSRPVEGVAAGGGRRRTSRWRCGSSSSNINSNR